MKPFRFVCALVLLSAVAAAAQNRRPEWVKVLPPAPITAVAGQKLEVPLEVEIMQGFHINADKPSYEYQIPTKLEWTSKEFKLLGIDYPKAEQTSFSFAPNEKLAVYQGMPTIRSRFEVPRTAREGKVTLQGKLRTQACDDKACYPPVTVPVEIPVEVKKKGK